MATVYSAEFLEKYEVLEEIYPDDRYPDARKRRDSRARQLRKEGWEVTSACADFTDLARCKAFTIYAERERG